MWDEIKKMNFKNEFLEFLKILKDEFLSFYNFFKNNRLLVALTALIVFICFGINLTYLHHGFDSDTAIFDYSATLSRWSSEQRYGLVWMKKILFPVGYNQFLEQALFQITIFIVVMYLSFIGSTFRSDKLKNYAFYLVPLFFIGSIATTELFTFQLQAFEVIFATLITIFAVRILYLGRNIFTTILSILIMFVSMTIYQSMAVAFIGMVCIMEILQILNSRGFKFAYFIISAMHKAAVLTFSVIMVMILPYISSFRKFGDFTHVVSSKYLMEQIQWGKFPISSNIKALCDGALDTLGVGGDAFHSPITIVLFIMLMGLVFCRFAKRRELPKLTSISICIIGVVLSVLAFNIIYGWTVPNPRIEYPTLPIVSSLMICLIIAMVGDRKKIANILLVVFLAVGFKFVVRASNITFAEMAKHRSEDAFIARVISKIQDSGISQKNSSEYRIIFVGYHDTTTLWQHSISELPAKSGISVESHMNWGNSDVPEESCNTTVWANRLMKVEGYDFKMVDGYNNKDICKEFFNKVREVKNIQEGDGIKIDKNDKIVVVKVS